MSCCEQQSSLVVTGAVKCRSSSSVLFTTSLNVIEPQFSRLLDSSNPETVCHPIIIIKLPHNNLSNSELFAAINIYFVLNYFL